MSSEELPQSSARSELYKAMSWVTRRIGALTSTMNRTLTAPSVERTCGFSPRGSAIFPNGESGLLMEARADLEQAPDPPINLRQAGGWIGDLAKDFQERGFPGAVPSDQPEHIPMLSFQIHVFERPNVSCDARRKSVHGARSDRARTSRSAVYRSCSPIRYRLLNPSAYMAISPIRAGSCCYSFIKFRNKYQILPFALALFLRLRKLQAPFHS
jgi:hypothetical protein